MCKIINIRRLEKVFRLSMISTSDALKTVIPAELHTMSSIVTKSCDVFIIRSEVAENQSYQVVCHASLRVGFKLPHITITLTHEYE